MSPKALFITLLLAGCLVLLIQGAGDFIRYRVEMKSEKIRLEQLRAAGIEDNGRKNEIRRRLFLSGAMAVAGAFGWFVYISRSTRRNINQTIKNKS